MYRRITPWSSTAESTYSFADSSASISSSRSLVGPWEPIADRERVRECVCVRERERERERVRVRERECV